MMLKTIMHATNSIKPAEITVVVIESHLVLSKIMPIMPNIKDTGAENKMSNPPRTGTGLPQPGLSMHIVRTTAPTIAIKTAESFPKSIFSPIKKNGNLLSYTKYHSSSQQLPYKSRNGIKNY
jgi:hypothetical protein